MNTCIKILLASFLTMSASVSGASGCDWEADGTAIIERTEIIKEYAIPMNEIVLGCLVTNDKYCLLQALNWNYGDSRIYRKEITVGSSNGSPLAYEVSLISDYNELKQAAGADLLTAKMILENVYGVFDDNCAGPYPDLKSGRYHLQFTHKDSKKTWDLYFLHWLQPTNMLPLFE